METVYVVMYRWSSRPTSLSRSGSWAISNRAREETVRTFQVMLAPPPSSFNFGERVQERRLVPSFLHDVLTNIRAATHDFMEAPRREWDDDGELAVSVLTALLVLQSVRLPGVAQQTCLMCTSSIAQSTPWPGNPTRLSMERRRLSGCGHWTLQEISTNSGWRDDVSSPRLCAFHASEFILAFKAVWGFVQPPARIRLERRHSF